MTPHTNQTVLTDEEIHTIARNMPDGAGGMLIKWGYQQFAHALESAVLEKLRALGTEMGNPTTADSGHEATANQPETRASIGSEAATNLMSPNPGDVALPPMKGLDPNHGIGRAMQDYARAAVLADRENGTAGSENRLILKAARRAVLALAAAAKLDTAFQTDYEALSDALALVSNKEENDG